MQKDVTSIGEYLIFTIQNDSGFRTEFRHGDRLLFSVDGVLTQYEKKRKLAEYLSMMRQKNMLDEGRRERRYQRAVDRGQVVPNGEW